VLLLPPDVFHLQPLAAAGEEYLPARVLVELQAGSSV
jgi:hypothetical protein